MLTRKDYKAIAAVFATTKASFPVMRWGMREEYLITSMASYMAQDNPNFDRDKFITACLSSLDAGP